MTDPNSVENKTQLLIVGGDKHFARKIRSVYSEDTGLLIHVEGDNWKSASWQRSRSAGKSWAIVICETVQGHALQELAECVRLVAVSFRPQRLIVLTPAIPVRASLDLLKAGADNLLSLSTEPKDIFRELEGEGIPKELYFPDPAKWLDSLSRVAAELDLSIESGLALKKLLRICVYQLDVTRASIMLVQDEGVRLAAAVGFPGEISYEAVIKVKEGSITDWVLKNRRSRLTVGRHEASKPLASGVSSAVSAPIIVEGEILGAVNFSCTEEDRQLTQADLATTEVFAALLGMAINNQRLVEDNIETERLAAIGATMATVSHCLKNLLTIFKGSAAIMERAMDQQDIGLAASGYNIVKNGVRRIENLVMDLLDMSKERTPDLEPTELDEFVKDIRELFSAAAQQKKHQFQTRSSIHGEYLLDSYRLQRALMNLLSNSLDAIQTGGVIRLNIESETNRLIFSVSDNGNGVPPEKLENIFDPFFSTKGSAGTGLGLAMVKKFCEENGGDVTADHDPELGGLRVRLALPIKNP